MPGPKRQPVTRVTLAQIPPEAIAIYERMRKLRCSCGNYPDRTKWTGRPQCRACTQWWDLHSQLADHIPHQPWQWPLLCTPTRHPIFDRTMRMVTDTMVAEEPNERQRELAKTLREAAREQRAREAMTNVATDRGAATPDPELGESTPPTAT